jgi:four helix bundle protein
MKDPQPEKRRKAESEAANYLERSKGPGGGTARTGAFWQWAEELRSDELVLRDQPENAAPRQDLLERTAVFGENIIRLAKRVPQTAANDRLINQIVGAGTSVGANYCEADDAVSGKDFKLKIGICRKESKETMFFLRMIAAADPSLAEEARKLWREAKELNLIFGAIWRK